MRGYMQKKCFKNKRTKNTNMKFQSEPQKKTVKKDKRVRDTRITHINGTSITNM